MQLDIADIVCQLEVGFDRYRAPEDLTDLVVAHLRTVGEVSAEALEWVDENRSNFSDEIDRKQAAAQAEGVFYPLEVFGSFREYVRGSCFPDPSLDPVIQEARKRRGEYSQARKELEAINWREFEILSKVVVEKMGALDAKFSPRSDDGGIDFYGRLELEGRLDDPLPLGGVDRRLRVWLVGQSKHYPEREVGPGDVRELVGAVELARTGGAPQRWEEFKLRPFDPVAYLFFTTGSFSSGAKNLLEKSGVVTMNGDQLATFLVDVGAGIDGTSGKFDMTLIDLTEG